MGDILPMTNINVRLRNYAEHVTDEAATVSDLLREANDRLDEAHNIIAELVREYVKTLQAGRFEARNDIIRRAREYMEKILL